MENNKKQITIDINYIDDYDLKELIEVLQDKLNEFTELGYANITVTAMYETIEISYERDKTELEIEEDKRTAEYQRVKEFETYERLKNKFKLLSDPNYPI